MQATEKTEERENNSLSDKVVEEDKKPYLELFDLENKRNVRLYTDGPAYYRAEAEDMREKGIADDDVERARGYSENVFILAGNIPAYNGHPITYYLNPVTGKGNAFLDYSVRFFIGRFRKEDVDEAKKDIKIKVVTLESKVA